MDLTTTTDTFARPVSASRAAAQTDYRAPRRTVIRVVRTALAPARWGLVAAWVAISLTAHLLQALGLGLLAGAAALSNQPSR